jgi:hypothetical protein
MSSLGPAANGDQIDAHIHDHRAWLHARDHCLAHYLRGYGAPQADSPHRVWEAVSATRSKPGNLALPYPLEGDLWMTGCPWRGQIVSFLGSPGTQSDSWAIAVVPRPTRLHR